MATEPPMASRTKSFSDAYSARDYQPSDVGSSRFQLEQEQQFGSMINEIERVRSRFENEKSNSDQFSQQMRMLAQQIESLTGQQSSMLGFHIGRMDTMLKELRNSSDAASKARQRAAFEAEQRAKFEQDRIDRERMERERTERERLERERRDREDKERRERMEREERERREMMDKLDRERREREERERKESEERKQREEQERLDSIKIRPLPSMNLSDIIPQPSRTVNPSKRKLSLDLGSSAAMSANGTSNDSNKRAKTGAGSEKAAGDFESMFQQFMTQNDKDKAPNAENSGASNEDAKVSCEPSDKASEPIDMDISALEDVSLPPTADAGADAGAPPTEDLPMDIQEALKQQAMAMLQAQLAADTALDSAPPAMDMDWAASSSAGQAQGSAIVKPEPNAAPQSSLAALMETAASSSSVAKPEPVVAKPEAAKPKVESKPKKAAASKGSSKKAKKPVTPAVEDTTVTDPMSVPLKNKAIHEWMSKDPERLYTADDICKAGIRYRASQTNTRSGTEKGKVYILSCRRDVSAQLAERRNNKKLWKFCNGGWKVILSQ